MHIRRVIQLSQSTTPAIRSFEELYKALEGDQSLKNTLFKSAEIGKIRTNKPCPRCREAGRDKHGDNLVVYPNGSAHCHACNFHVRKYNPLGIPLGNTIRDTTPRDNLIGLSLPERSEGPNRSSSRYHMDTTVQVIPHRGLVDSTLRKYGVKVRVADDGKPIEVELPYGESKVVRKWDVKEFRWEGHSSSKRLFGQDQFSAGQAKDVTICESAYDAMSTYQMLGGYHPVVAVGSASTAESDCKKAYEYLNSFQRIYLCFDNDSAGETAAKSVQRLFDVNKVYHVKLTKHKDANEYLTSDDSTDAKTFSSVWQSAKLFLPRGVITSYDDVQKVLAAETSPCIGTYPFDTLQQMTFGIRQGEMNLFTAQEKIGKTEVMRAIEYHLLKTTDYNLGVIHLEEGERRAIQGLIGYELGLPVHLPDSGVSPEDQQVAYKSLVKREGRLYLYSHFGSDDASAILDVLRYLVGVCDCKFIFLDHITMLVTAHEDDDERRRLDYLSTRLAQLTRDLGFTLFLVSHVNDDGKTRGSRNISKVADLIVHLDRDIEADTFDKRNKTILTIKGNRFAGTTGPAGTLWFDNKTHKLKELTLEDINNLNVDLS